MKRGGDIAASSWQPCRKGGLYSVSADTYVSILECLECGARYDNLPQSSALYAVRKVVLDLAVSLCGSHGIEDPLFLHTVEARIPS